MDQRQALHTKARRYCMERQDALDTEYWSYRDWGVYSDPLCLTPRGSVVKAILTAVEAIVPQNAPTQADLVNQLIKAGETADSHATLYRLNNPERDNTITAMLDERALFAKTIQEWDEDALCDVEPLPYRRTILRDERDQLWERLTSRWPWFSKRNLTSQYILMVDEEAFYHHVGGNVLCDLIRAHGAERIYQVNDDKIGEREVDISDFDVPNHADDWYRFDDSFDWFIATTHNNLAVIAGEWLVPTVKALWPNWADYPYTPPQMHRLPPEERLTKEDFLKSRGESQYMKAVYQGKTSEVEAILDEGMDIQTQPYRRGSALHYAAAIGQSDIAALLIQRGADINARNGHGVTPLMDAVSNGHVAVIAQLLAAGADTTLRANASEDANADISYRAGATLNLNARVGLTALEIAEQSAFIAALGDTRRLEILKLLA